MKKLIDFIFINFFINFLMKITDKSAYFTLTVEFIMLYFRYLIANSLTIKKHHSLKKKQPAILSENVYTIIT